MSETKHTPGPWIVDPLEPSKAVVSNEVGDFIADCNPGFEEDVPDECKANTAMIVRAVNCHAELLEAVETALEMADGVADAEQADGRFDAAESVREYEKFLRAIIAKAKGGAA